MKMIVSNYEEQGFVIENDIEIQLVSHDESEGVANTPESSTYNSSLAYDGDYFYNQSVTLAKSAMGDVIIERSDVIGEVVNSDFDGFVFTDNKL